MALATRVIDFSTQQTLVASGVSVILDPTGNLDADGNQKTAFTPGDLVSLLAILPDDLRLVSAAVTVGDLTRQGQVTRPYKDQILFATPDEEQGLSYKPTGSASVSWYGRIGSISTDIERQAVKANPGSGLPAIGDVIYPFVAEAMTLQIPGNLSIAEGQTYPVGIVVYVETV